MITFENVSAYYDSTKVLEGVTLKIEEPSIVAIIGPNGSGKTTFLKTFLNLVKYEGKIEIMGHEPRRDYAKIRKMVGYMPQKEHVATDLPIRVKDVVLMSVLAKKSVFSPPRKSDVEKAKSSLRLVGLEKLWNRNFSKLSGGQQQRVLLARAIATDPKILLLDEPFNGMDVPSQQITINLLQELKFKKGVYSFVVVHDLITLAPCADYILILKKKMYGFGKPWEVLKEDLLERVYGRRIPIIQHEGVCYALIGDRHA